MWCYFSKALLISLAYVCFLQLPQQLLGQKLELIPAAGAQYSDAGISTNWSIGEPVIKTIGNQSHFATQGFNQTEWIVLSEWDYVPLNLSVGLYPNPLSRELNISFPGREDLRVNYRVLVYDMLYKPVFEAELPYEENQYDLSNLDNGTYILHIIDENGNFLKTFKIVKNR